MKVTIDRFEGNKAVCERADRTMTEFPRDSLPSEAKEGDVLIIERNRFRIDDKATKKRKKAAENMIKNIWKA